MHDTMAAEIMAGQALGTELKVQGRRSLCDPFPLFRDYAGCFFLCFCFGIGNMGGRKRRCVVIDNRIRTWFCFVIYTSVFTIKFTGKNEQKTLHAIHPSCYSVPCFCLSLTVFS